MPATTSPSLAGRSASSQFARDVLRGLTSCPKNIPSMYFYDERGSRLFQEITESPDYYLTRCESEILQASGPEIASRLRGSRVRVWEAGAGDGRKTEILLRQLLEWGFDCEYMPVDICSCSVDQAVAAIRQRCPHPRLSVTGLVADYFEALDSLSGNGTTRQNLVLYLGSNIGNLKHRTSRRFLRLLRRSLRPGDAVLIGFDLVKDPHVLQRAYDDEAGITREFNFNLLDRINRELGGEFERDSFAHHVVYQPRRHCMESWLLSRREQRIFVERLGREFHFDAWEGIRTEQSYKYTTGQIESFASSGEFIAARHYFDAARYFADSLWLAGGEKAWP